LDQHVRVCGLRPDDRLQLAMPLFHNAGMASGLGAGWRIGAHVVCFSGPFRPNAVLAQAAEQQITVAHWIPTMLHRLTAYLENEPLPLGSLRAIHFGAMPISPALLERMRQVFDAEFTQLYGSTDCGLVGYSDDLRDASRENDFRVEADSGVRILSDNFQDVAIGDVGQIAVTQTQSGMIGYWQDDARTRGVVQNGVVQNGVVQNGVVQNGVVLSGDMARNLGDGRMALIGRQDDLIISGGENLYPSGVENVLADHPALRKVVVVGVPDDEFGQLVCVVAVLNVLAEVTLANLQDHCADKLPGYTIPRPPKIVSALPKTGAGKVARAAVRDLM
jgi:acyl-CoA synthetase (AMP-forming)/AMP-acid ligase II